MKTLASLVLALTFSLAAGAVSAQEARISWGDLDLSSTTGADAFDARVSAAAARMCRGAKRPGSRINDRAFCRAAFHDEAVRQLPRSAQAAYALSRLLIVA